MVCPASTTSDNVFTRHQTMSPTLPFGTYPSPQTPLVVPGSSPQQDWSTQELFIADKHIHSKVVAETTSVVQPAMSDIARDSILVLQTTDHGENDTGCDRTYKKPLIVDERITWTAASGTLSGSHTGRPDIDHGSVVVVVVVVVETTLAKSANAADHDLTSSTNDDRNTCDACGRSFRRTADLRRHARKHGEPKFTCNVPGCERAFYRIDKFRNHARQKHRRILSSTDSGSLCIEIDEQAARELEKPRLHPCKECNSMFETKGQLNSHTNRKHEKRFSCEECDSAFNLQADLQRHKASVHGASAKLAWRCTNAGCLTPNKVFVRKDNFLRHARRCEQSIRKQVEDDAVDIE